MRTRTSYVNNLNGLTNEKALLMEPLQSVPIEQRRGIIALHGRGADATVWTPGWAGARHAQALADAGFTVLSIDAGGGYTFNNIAAMDAITNAYTYLTGTIGLANSKVGLFGWSMGGGNALQWIKENPTKVACALLWCPLSDLDYHALSGGVPTAEAEAAYSPPIYPGGSYVTNSVGHKIADEYPTWRNKCPIRIIQGLADTTVPPSKSTAFVNGVNAAPGSPAPNIVDQVQLAGSDHTTLFQNYAVENTVDYFNDNHVLTGVYVPAPIKLLAPESVKYQDSARTTLATVDNDPVGSWSDLVSTNHAIQATAGKRPVLKKNVLNGFDVIQLDGVDDYMEAPMSAKIASTLFLVSRKMSAVTSAGRVVIGWKFNSSARQILYATSALAGGGYGYFSDEAVTTSADIGGVATDWNIIVIRCFSASDVDFFINGGSPEVEAFNPSDILITAITLMLGSNNNSAGTFGDFQIAEISRYDGSMTADQINEVAGALADKYNLAWTEIA